MRRRPYQRETNDYLYQLFRDYSDDFIEMKDVVYEVAFRKTVHKNQRSEIVEHFLDMIEDLEKDRSDLKTKIFESTLKIFLLEQRITELDRVS